MFTALFPPRLAAPSRPGRLRRATAGLGLAALLATATATAQQVAPLDTTGLDASGNLRSELAACNSGNKTQQDRATCIREARSAAAERRAGRLGSGADYTANALRRCEIFKESEDLAACRARVESQARLDGSVAAGGVLREAETTVPAQPAQ